MGVEMVIIFITAVLVLCGLVLLLSAGEASGRRAGFYMLVIGVLGIFISVVSYPRDRNRVPVSEYGNEATTNYDNR